MNLPPGKSLLSSARAIAWSVKDQSRLFQRVRLLGQPSAVKSRRGTGNRPLCAALLIGAAAVVTAGCSEPPPPEFPPAPDLVAMSDHFEGDAATFVDVTQGQGVVYLAAEQLAPACRLTDADVEAARESFLACIARVLPVAPGEMLRNVSVNSGRYQFDVQRGGRQQSLRIESMASGIPVSASVLKLALNADGELTQLIGRLADPGAYQAAGVPMPESELSAVVVRQLDGEVTLIDRAFDTSRGSFVARFYKVGDESRVYSFDERTRNLFDVRTHEYGNHALVNKTVKKSNYTNGFRQTSEGDGTAALTARGLSSDCRVFLDHGASHAAGEPLITRWNSATGEYSEVISGIASCDGGERLSFLPPDDA